jgi:hypothetical protein
MKYLIAAILLFFTTTAFAETDHSLFFPLASYHIDREMGECETNPGLYYQRFKTKRIFWTAGAFRNSKCNTAVIAQVGWESYDKKRLLGVPYGYGAMAGFSTGYNSPIIAAPYIRIGDRDDRFSLRILALPHPKQGIFGIGLAYKL